MIFEIILFSPYIDSIILKGIESSYREEFPISESLFEIVISKMPSHPVGYFLNAALYQLEYFDEGVDSIKGKFFSTQKECIKRGKEYVKENPDDPYGYFFLGAAYTLTVFLSGYTGDYINALRNLLPALNNITKSIHLDTTLYDAYLGLGGYDYFKGMLPFMKGEKKKAFDKIKLAMEKGKYTKYLSYSALANLYIREKKYEEARDVLREVLEIFPSSRTFTWPYFTSFYEEGNLDSAIFYSKKLIELSKDNYFCYLQGVYFTCEILLRGKKIEEIILLTDSINYDAFPEWGKKIKDIREKAIKR